jgi:hypothetical protein
MMVSLLFAGKLYHMFIGTVGHNDMYFMIFKSCVL